LVDGEAVVGLAVGVIQDGGRHTFGFGRISADNDQRPNADTLYEIGSITKTFTGLLLADLVERKLVALDDPLQKYLPEDLTLATKGDQPIRLVDLSTHYSGLPRLPDNMAPADPNNPYADYDRARMHDFLRAWKPARAPGDEMEYSNLAVGLLGDILAERAGTDYEGLVTERVLKPLGMDHTRIKLTDDDLSRLAPGHNVDLSPVANWDLDALAGAGALRSTVNDMLTFLEANIDPASTPLKEAITASHQSQHRSDSPPGQIALGWMIAGDGRTVWHNGGTGGYHSFAAFDSEAKRGVVVLCNTSTDIVDQLGINIVRSLAGQEVPPPNLPKAVAVDAEVLARYAGKYQLAPTVVITVTAEGNKLLAQLTGQDTFRVYPVSDTEFRYRVVDARLVFVTNDAGEVEKVVLHQNGREMPAKRFGE
jgi:D-alanyl-D-alanine-carboxypeptidase/D-alanyl-D-alanine-endopeptidase